MSPSLRRDIFGLIGWLALSAGGHATPFFGLELPALIGPDKSLASAFKEIHETVGTFGYYLIGLHALAALFHHYVIRDNTLVRMLPIAPGAHRPERAPTHRSAPGGHLEGQ